MPTSQQNINDERTKDILKKKNRRRCALVALICTIVVLVLFYLVIIVAQRVEFNKLDQSLIGEIVVDDKDTTD